MLVTKSVLIFHIIDCELYKKLIKYRSSTPFWQTFVTNTSFVFDGRCHYSFLFLRKISCYGWFDWTRCVLIAFNEMAQRELRFLKRRAAKGTTLLSLICEDAAGVALVIVFVVKLVEEVEVAALV